MKPLRSFLIGVTLTMLLMVSTSSYAQTRIVFDAAGNIVGSYVGPRNVVSDYLASAGRSGLGGTANPAGVSAGVNSVAKIALGTAGGGGGDIVVPYAADAALGADAIAGAASRFVPFVGQAVTAGIVAGILKDHGFRYGDCTHPGLIVGPASSYCAPPTDQALYTYSSSYAPQQFPTAQAACDAGVRAAFDASWSGALVRDGMWCDFVRPSGDDTGNGFPISTNVNTGSPVYQPASADAIKGAIKLAEIANSNLAKQLFDAIRTDFGANPNWNTPDTNPVTPDTPLTVNAPPVIGPSVQTSSQTFPNGDGTTSTRNVNKQTTVTPTTTGSTVGDSQTSFPSQTITITNTTNNSTGAVTTTTNTTNNASPLKLPDDYNREITQQEILKQLDLSAQPDGPDQTAIVQKKTDDAAKDLDNDFKNIPTQFAPDKTNWFSWVWTPPIGLCVPITGTLNKLPVSIDYCPTVNNIRDLIGFLFAFFAAWQIYNMMFKE